LKRDKEKRRRKGDKINAAVSSKKKVTMFELREGETAPQVVVVQAGRLAE
jgi:hypothetical protein